MSSSDITRRDWLAEDAVECEPVSAIISLISGKNTAYFADLGLLRAKTALT